MNISNLNLSEFWFVHDVELSFNKKKDIVHYLKTCQDSRGTALSILQAGHNGKFNQPCLCVG